MCRARRPSAVLTNWFNRYEGLRSHIAVGLLARPTFPRERLERMVARGDARSRLLVKAIEHAPDAGAAMMDALDNGQIIDKLAAAELAGVVGNPAPSRRFGARWGTATLATIPTTRWCVTRRCARWRWRTTGALSARPPPARPRPAGRPAE